MVTAGAIQRLTAGVGTGAHVDGSGMLRDAVVRSGDVIDRGVQDPTFP
jgi:hypothetical protein